MIRFGHNFNPSPKYLRIQDTQPVAVEFSTGVNEAIIHMLKIRHMLKCFAFGIKSPFGTIQYLALIKSINLAKMIKTKASFSERPTDVFINFNIPLFPVSFISSTSIPLKAE